MRMLRPRNGWLRGRLVTLTVSSLLVFLVFIDSKREVLVDRTQQLVDEYTLPDEVEGDAAGRPVPKYQQLEDVPAPKVPEISCRWLFSSELEGQKERNIASHFQKYRNGSKSFSAGELILQTRPSNCENFKQTRKYTTKPISAEEESFSIAFSIILYRDPGQVERLLRAIYRPTNYYCLHVDQGSPPEVHKAISSLANCFNNVFVARKSTNVDWGYFSVVEPEITCMEDLMRFPNWKYFINLTGQEFPLKTNLDLIRILKVYNGANDIPGVALKRLPTRFREWVEYSRQPHVPPENKTLKAAFPLGLNFTKGSVHVTASRAFVDFLLNNPVSKSLRDWFNDTFVPDEMYFSTLNHNYRLRTPGSYIGGSSMAAFSMNRYKMWRHTGPCKGKFVRYICVVGLGDLPLLGASRHLFVNKLNDDYQPLAYDCLEELHYNRTREDMLGIERINTTFYKNLPFVLHSRRDIRDSRDWAFSERELDAWRNETLARRARADREFQLLGPGIVPFDLI